MMKHATTLLLLLFALSSFALGQPKAPLLVIGDGPPTAIVWKHPTQVLSAWARVDAVPAPGIVVQGFASRDRLLVDVFNVGGAPIRIAFADVVGEEGEFDRIVPPGAGIGWSSSPPTLLAEDPGAGAFDKAYALKTWPKTDTGWTMQTGSPRNRLFSSHRYRAEHGGLSRAMEASLERFDRWQLMRTYQDPEATRGIPRTLLGLPAGGGEWVKYPFLGSDTVTPGDSHHFTVGDLADSFLLTGSPRALDQLVRLLSWGLASISYYGAGGSSYGGAPYGGVERVPGWLLVALADGMEVSRAAGPMFGFLRELLAARAVKHVELLAGLGFNEEWLPNVVAPPDARHVLVPHNLPWQGAIVAFGLLRVDAEGIPGAGELAERWLDYLELRGWNGDPDSPVVFDAVPHNPEDQGILPSKAGVPGVGLWLAPPLILAGRLDSPLLGYLVDVGKRTKSSGIFLFSPTGWVGIYGPLIEIEASK